MDAVKTTLTVSLLLTSFYSTCFCTFFLLPWTSIMLRLVYMNVFLRALLLSLNQRASSLTCVLFEGVFLYCLLRTSVVRTDCVISAGLVQAVLALKTWSVGFFAPKMNLYPSVVTRHQRCRAFQHVQNVVADHSACCQQELRWSFSCVHCYGALLAGSVMLLGRKTSVLGVLEASASDGFQQGAGEVKCPTMSVFIVPPPHFCRQLWQ